MTFSAAKSCSTASTSAKINLQDLRRLFGIVIQDPFLFTGTIESNVRLGTPNIDRDTVENAICEIGLADFIESLPEGVAASVNERGSTLSVGQRQLINFARALAHNPRFLILDEATSSVDTKTELQIRDALDRLLSGRTALVIAHRLSTIQHADRILVFHKGRLREQGAHQELLAQRGIYYRLYQLQYKEQELHLPEDSGAARPRPGSPLTFSSSRQRLSAPLRMPTSVAQVFAAPEGAQHCCAPSGQDFGVLQGSVS